MTIEEVKEHFKDAKTVRCLFHRYEIFSIPDLNLVLEFDSGYWYEGSNYSVLLYSKECDQLAEIIEYKQTKPTTKPTHYQTDSIDVIDFCSAYGLNFNRGNIIKYVARAGKKDNELKDLEKALDYINREIQTIKNK